MESAESSPTARTADDAILESAEVEVTTTLPSLQERDYVAPLADAYSRIDPTTDGWDTEAFHEQAVDILGALAKQLMTPDKSITLPMDSSFQTSAWVPPTTTDLAVGAPLIQITRLDPAQGALPLSLNGSNGLTQAATHFQSLFAEDLQVKFKHYRIVPEDAQVGSRIRVEAKGYDGNHRKVQVTAEWDATWTPTTPPTLRSIQVAEWEKVVYQGDTSTLFEDRTALVMDKNPAFREQYLRGTDHWRKRLPRVLGLDVVANHGLALGDINGDRLDDLYICAQGGLPNRLFLRNPDGTLKDITESSGTGWLDYCASALLIDIDNDGDRDLVVGQEWRILFMDNLGDGKFELAFGIGTHAQTFSLAAADFDVDGDLDVYVCGYNPSADNARSGEMGEPMPYHDARNGGRNMLLRNDGNWEFNDAAEATGLNQNNDRFSFAAAWEDYDNDGDLDLYVANDYGRNNLYQNTNGRFKDVADMLGIEDMSSGMSVAWGDHNRDGLMDLYVSNMFSAAGNRITYQRQFKTSEDADTRSIFQRHARGNSLFEGIGNGAFQDVSVEADVTMGRWAWASNFVDLNNDSHLDLVIANGFITTEDTGDL